MLTLSTYNKAKDQIEILTNYVGLVDDYNVDTVENAIIHLYAMHSSISKVIKHIKTQTYSFELDYSLITHEFVRQVILSKPNDELHSIIQKIFKKKVKPRKDYYESFRG